MKYLYLLLTVLAEYFYFTNLGAIPYYKFATLTLVAIIIGLVLYRNSHKTNQIVNKMVWGLAYGSVTTVALVFSLFLWYMVQFIR